MLKSVAYVIRSFPEPSETFIAEEAASLIRAGIQPCIIHLKDGSAAVVHPAAQTLLQMAPRLLVPAASAFSAVKNLCRWMTVAPIRTLRTLGQALRHPNRWCYFQALGPAWWSRQQGVQFLHAHFADVNFQYAACISAWSGIPFGVTTHGYDLREDPLGYDGASELYRKADAIVTISEYNRRYMVQRYGLPQAKISVVHCGVDVERFALFARSAPPAGAPLRLLNVGRLAPEKGQDLLLHALARLRQQGLQLHLDIVGGGELEQALKALADQLGLAGFITFHGVQPEQVIRQLHQRADLFVLPSRAEGLPVACIEAMAMGTVSIASRITGIPELIDHGVSGLLVEAGDAVALAEAIATLQADPAMAQRLRLGGRATVLAGFDRAKCTQQLIGVWSQQISSH
ncbi:glycosyltransferase family 4 protein [Paucibacter sp. PLA-PC-4]|uniref:glycosyltransferase family 4 protein n=1 Tax=Paucibacter sp. PLA-PC-4 TaxID=2993655 RepID=UPI00224A675C|nr:glycosyltransferase family 4 protein [Paucibacter sp. PLA-PC-4]MCX2865011.1 glycosyltransferase family 4 protein [Paucibacter sp. PLA-PC-4]